MTALHPSESVQVHMLGVPRTLSFCFMVGIQVLLYKRVHILLSFGRSGFRRKAEGHGMGSGAEVLRARATATMGPAAGGICTPLSPCLLCGCMRLVDQHHCTESHGQKYSPGALLWQARKNRCADEGRAPGWCDTVRPLRTVTDLGKSLLRKR